MNTIIKNKSKFQFLKSSIDQLKRANRPLPNREILLTYREILKMTERFTWNNYDGV